MHAGGVVRKIESWGTRQLPQRMKKKRTSVYEQIGEYVPHLIYPSCHSHIRPATGHFIVTPALKPSAP